MVIPGYAARPTACEVVHYWSMVRRKGVNYSTASLQTLSSRANVLNKSLLLKISVPYARGNMFESPL